MHGAGEHMLTSMGIFSKLLKQNFTKTVFSEKEKKKKDKFWTPRIAKRLQGNSNLIS